MSENAQGQLMNDGLNEEAGTSYTTELQKVLKDLEQARISIAFYDELNRLYNENIESDKSIIKNLSEHKKQCEEEKKTWEVEKEQLRDSLIKEKKACEKEMKGWESEKKKLQEDDANLKLDWEKANDKRLTLHGFVKNIRGNLKSRRMIYKSTFAELEKDYVSALELIKEEYKTKSTFFDLELQGWRDKKKNVEKQQKKREGNLKNEKRLLEESVEENRALENKKITIQEKIKTFEQKRLKRKKGCKDLSEIGRIGSILRLTDAIEDLERIVFPQENQS